MTNDEIKQTFRTDDGLGRNYLAAEFLDAPAPEVVRAAIDEIRRLRGILKDHAIEFEKG